MQGGLGVSISPDSASSPEAGGRFGLTPVLVSQNRLILTLTGGSSTAVASMSLKLSRMK